MEINVYTIKDNSMAVVSYVNEEKITKTTINNVEVDITKDSVYAQVVDALETTRDASGLVDTYMGSILKLFNVNIKTKDIYDKAIAAVEKAHESNKEFCKPASESFVKRDSKPTYTKESFDELVGKLNKTYNHGATKTQYENAKKFSEMYIDDVISKYSIDFKESYKNELIQTLVDYNCWLMTRDTK